MTRPPATRDRIVDEAMRLFAERGFKATTIVEIERAAGLTPGAGGIYHHFKSKDALLRAGLERHLARLEALRDIREVFGGVGDLETQLTLMARYLLAEVDNEAVLFGVVAAEARTRSDLLDGVIDRLVGASVRSFAQWLTEQAERDLPDDEALALASVALGGLLTGRLQRIALGVEAQVDDATLVATWVALVATGLRR